MGDLILSSFLKSRMKQYRDVYQKYMGYSDKQMPTDECLIHIALSCDMRSMLEEMENKKND